MKITVQIDHCLPSGIVNEDAENWTRDVVKTPGSLREFIHSLVIEALTRLLPKVNWAQHTNLQDIIWVDNHTYMNWRVMNNDGKPNTSSFLEIDHYSLYESAREPVSEFKCGSRVSALRVTVTLS